MIESGEAVPSFTLPAVRDGELEALDLDSYLGERVVILAFYPGDFNPACSDGETGLDELDLFTMQKDVTVLAISGDSVYSHRAFAEEYNLHMPLLSDTDGSVAESYGVAVDDETAGHLTKRAVIVVDHTGTVQYTWKSEDPAAVPTAEAIREAIEDIGDDRTAESRYGVGHAHYMEGRRAFTSAMKAYESQEWMMAQTDFTQAAEEFDEAGEEFNTAVRFAESADSRTYFERAEQKSEALWRAADWLAESASAFASGQGAKGESLRGDAEAPLETARDLHEPPAPDEFPPETDPAEEDEEKTVHPLAEEDEQDPTLDADIGTETAETGSAGTSPADEATPVAGPGDQGDGKAETTEPVDGAAGGTTAEATPTEDGTETGTENQSEGADEIDDEELEEITAELEEQTEAAELSDPEPGGGNVVPDDIDAESGGDPAEQTDGEPAELELTDPTEEDDREKDESGREQPEDQGEQIENDSDGNHSTTDSS